MFPSKEEKAGDRLVNFVPKTYIGLMILKLKSGTKQIAAIATQIKLPSRDAASTSKKRGSTVTDFLRLRKISNKSKMFIAM